MPAIEDKYIGLALAVVSTLGIGASFIITKKGLNDAADKHGFEGDGFAYLKTPLWWAGIVSLVLGELANFAAYAFAPAILVTPLGALSVLIGAVLGAYFLDEQLGVLGKLGCATCLLGAIIIVLHAPPDEPVETVDQILEYAIQPGKQVTFLITPTLTDTGNSFPYLLRDSRLHLRPNDIQSRPYIRKEEPFGLHLGLLDYRIHLSHVHQGFWNCAQIDLWREQSIHTSIDICLHCGLGHLYLDPDELSQ